MSVLPNLVKRKRWREGREEGKREMNRDERVAIDLRERISLVQERRTNGHGRRTRRGARDTVVATERQRKLL